MIFCFCFKDLFCFLKKMKHYLLDTVIMFIFYLIRFFNNMIFIEKFIKCLAFLLFGDYKKQHLVFFIIQ